MENGCSAWILIQPNELALDRFKAMCLLSPETSGHPMAPHLAFLSAAQMGWKTYIGQLRLSLQDLVSRRSTQ